MESVHTLLWEPDKFFTPETTMLIVGGIILLAVLELTLKGIALWRAAHMQKMPWFVALLVVNSAGILPIIFLLLTRDAWSKRSV